MLPVDFAWSGCIVNQHLYVGRLQRPTDTPSILIYDISNPWLPKQVGEVFDAGSPYHLCPLPPHRLLATTDRTSRVYSLSDPANPTALFDANAIGGRHAIVHKDGQGPVLVSGGGIYRIAATELEKVGTFRGSGQVSGFPYHGDSRQGWVAAVSISQVVLLSSPEEADRRREMPVTTNTKVD